MKFFYEACRITVSASLLFCTAFFCSCSQDEPVAEPAVRESEPYAVTCSEALAALRTFTSDGSSTRMSPEREVRTVEVLNRRDLSGATRSAVAALDQPLAYIVNFDGGGYAVLGADTRQGGVVALVEHGSMDAATLVAAKAVCDRGGDVEFIDMIDGSVVAYLLDAADGKYPVEASQTRITLPPPGGWDPIEQTLLCTEWTQWAPYNDNCQVIGSVRAPVGCVAQTLTQILACNYAKHNASFNGFYYKENPSWPIQYFYVPQWSVLSQAIETPTPTGTCMTEVSKMLYCIGLAIGMKYGQNESTAEMGAAAVFLRDIAGYKNVAVRTRNLTDIKRLIATYRTPVAARGTVGASNSLHAWVIDGYKEVVDYVYGSVNGQMQMIPVINEYVYCRFGFGKDHNGWYNYPTLLPKAPDVSKKNYCCLAEIIYYTL